MIIIDFAKFISLEQHMLDGVTSLGNQVECYLSAWKTWTSIIFLFFANLNKYHFNHYHSKFKF